ncbi:hypothetical protein HG535_0E04920 [Zygotorulaspora mrakii]|uniref:SPIN90/Ldb17 leucine-rich domain-containing protein n=1 Tax=Zygotorulaspora mrakii TaxID=42260 RepID=A0A7H9B427_ZYGMR|nr:uncharacterized protein HG535_0E04920 [Zygotorulaspora mrakii]QLG73408.1 hypothetical protein HG535_0E04920 [Zygotorulaspora mrakii]
MILDESEPLSESHNDDELMKFWLDMERIVNIPADQQNKNSVNSALVGYIKKSCDSYMDYIRSDKEMCRLAMVLTDSPIMKNEKRFCLSKLLSLLNIDLLEMNMKFIIAYILLWESKQDLNSLEIMLQFQGFNVFYNTLYTQFAYLNKYGEDKHISQEKLISADLQELNDIEIKIMDEMRQICVVLMDVLFLVFKYCKCSVTNVQTIDDFFIYFLMSTIRSDTMDDLFNNAQFKLILALNEQYMMLTKNFEIENKIFKYLSNDAKDTRFVELLLLKLNRVQDSSLQIMMCKILYIILTSKDGDLALNFFYLNDLHVFADVLIRELQNISENEELLRNYFLRLLIPLLNNTEISRTHYRKHDISKLLTYLSSIENSCSSENLGREHAITSKLASKVLEQVPWLEKKSPSEEQCNSEETSSRKSSVSTIVLTPTATTPNNDKKTGQFYLSSESDYSAESLGMRKSRPPPPLPPSRKQVLRRTHSHLNDKL